MAAEAANEWTHQERELTAFRRAELARDASRISANLSPAGGASLGRYLRRCLIFSTRLQASECPQGNSGGHEGKGEKVAEEVIDALQRTLGLPQVTARVKHTHTHADACGAHGIWLSHAAAEGSSC